MLNIDIPPFRPHRLLRSGHAQTIAGVLFPGRAPEYSADAHHVWLTDGDRLVQHEDSPARWSPGDRTALSPHALSGCQQSGYTRGFAAKLNAAGVRTFRMDLRGAGAGAELA